MAFKSRSNKSRMKSESNWLGQDPNYGGTMTIATAAPSARFHLDYTPFQRVAQHPLWHSASKPRHTVAGEQDGHQLHAGSAARYGIGAKPRLYHGGSDHSPTVGLAKKRVADSPQHPAAQGAGQPSHLAQTLAGADPLSLVATAHLLCYHRVGHPATALRNHGVCPRSPIPSSMR